MIHVQVFSKQTKQKIIREFESKFKVDKGQSRGW